MAETLTKIPRHLSFYVAALAVAALVIGVAVMTAGPAEAQRTGDNAEKYSQPYPCSEELQPDADTDEVLDSGHYALFDAFWDYEVGHLSNNFCPPTVVHTTEYDPATEQDVPVNERSGTNIHISETAFSVPDRYRVTVVDSAEPNGNPSNASSPKIDLASYPFLRGAVSAVKPGPDSTAENPTWVFADNKVWWVKAEDVPANTDTSTPLILDFSTDLLEEADWYLADGDDADTEPDPPVQFEFVAVHVLQDGTQQEAHVVGAHFFAFDPGASQTTPRWSNVTTATESEVNMFTGQYRHMQYVFTKPGEYLVQAHVQAHVRNTDDPEPADGRPDGWEQISPNKSITSPAEWYTFHVGAHANLSTAVTAGAVSGSAVPITVTAVNNGPNDAENAEVEINLPPGLSAPATLPAGASSNGCGVIAWKIGTMTSGASSNPTLTFNATVDDGATGNLAVTAEIRSTTFDPDATDNAASAEATLSGTNVRPPFFPGVSRYIAEHAVGGAHAGDPVAAESPEGRTLTYTLSGRCSNWFQAHSNGQIVLASGRSLNYEKQWEYPLVLSVSDGVNASGGADTSADDSTPVTILVGDTEPDAVHPTVTFTLSNASPDAQPNLDLNHPVLGNTINVNTNLKNLPEGVTPTYTWDIPSGYVMSPSHTSYFAAAAVKAGIETYTVHIKWDGGGITASYAFEWFNP